VQEPFFAFVHYGEAHIPLRPPAPYDRMFMPAGIGAPEIRALCQDAAAVVAGVHQVSADEARILGALYDGALRYVDMRLQQIAEALVKQGCWERTLFLVVGDHGQFLGERGLIGHPFGLYDVLLCTPFLLRCPGLVPAGFVVDALAQPTDVLPTIAALAGVAAEQGLPGRPIVKEGQATASPAFAIAEGFRPSLSAVRQRFPQFDSEHLGLRRKAIRTRREKFIWHSNEANELYDLTRDPAEEHNIIEREGERAEALRRALFDWLASTEPAQSDGHERALNAAMRRQLRRLGELE
jgi:arylsulfatase A-like enzyme